jgi:hypothetical protein
MIGWGAATLKKIKLATESRDFEVDSLNIYVNARFGQRELVVKSDLFDVSLMGRLHSESGKRCRDKLAKECRLFSNG